MATTVHQVVPVLCRVVRTLRYAPFKHFIGKVVMVPGPASVAGAVQRELGLQAAFGDLTHEEDRTELAIARYGLIDLQYELSPSALASYGRPKNADLVELGFKSGNTLKETGTECIDGVLEEIDENRAYLKLFLREGNEPSPAAGLERVRRGLPDDYWPCRFTVVDACLTNAPSIWLEKHFYW